MNHSEKILLIAAAGYSRSQNVSLTKISWALSSILQKPENSIYHQLKEIDDDLDTQLQEIFGLRRMAEVFGDQSEGITDDSLESRIGEIVMVEVLSVKTFGAVCKVEDTTRTLLLHLSEVANQFITDLREHLKEGDRIQAMLIMNPKNELGLSTRKLKARSQTDSCDQTTKNEEEQKNNE